MSRMILLLLLTTIPAGDGCDRPQDHLAGQKNVRVIFYGLAVDENGRPLEAATFQIISEAFPDDWTFETRGRPHDRKTFQVRSDATGRFEIELVTRGIFIEHAERAGYRHLTAKLGEASNMGIMISSWGRQLYKSDPNRPAVYVFVKDGVREVSALPSRGGYYAYGKDWRPNEAAWPLKPSLTDVVQKTPATQAAATRD